MGEAKRKAAAAAQEIEFDFCAPAYSLNRVYLQNAGGDKIRALENATKAIIRHLIDVKFRLTAAGGGMNKSSGDMGAIWQEILDDADEEDHSRVVKIQRGHLAWLSKIANEEDLGIDPRIPQWRNALADYLTQILNAPAPDPDQETTV